MTARRNEYTRTRDFFAALKWTRDGAQSPYSIFTTEELHQTPLKWLKYLLLERVGLTTLRELTSSIRRFRTEEIYKIESVCHELLEDSQAALNETMLVIKVVFADKAGQLPNFRVCADHEVAPAITEIANTYLADSQEIWLCQSNISSNGTNFGGRMTFTGSGTFAPDLLEIVWFASPRRIEEYRDKGFPYPFLRARRNPGSIRFSLDALSIPDAYRAVLNFETRLMQEYHWVVRTFLAHRERIDLLAEILVAAGAQEVSIEFKSSASRFSFIDWDTEVETTLR